MSFGSTPPPAPSAVPVAAPAPLFPGAKGAVEANAPGAINTATSAFSNAASGVDVGAIFKSVVDASKRGGDEGRANVMSSMGASGMGASSDAMRGAADYELQFQANLLQQLQQMQFQNEAVKMGGAQGLMDTYGNAAMTFAPTEEIVGGAGGPSAFSQATGAATGGAAAAAMLIIAL